MLNPLIAICGTTGVGKSKLAIDIALSLANASYGKYGWHRARVINADSMQVYRGLNIITNKVSAAEMQNVDHLLMGFKEPGEQYVVGDWVEDSLKLINEMHQKKEVPIIVGGTSYWIQHLIFPNRLAKNSKVPAAAQDASDWDPELQAIILALPETLRTLFDELPNGPPSAKTDPDLSFSLHTLLMHLDPSVGQRWHWKDTRKVLHSLNVIRSSRRKASAIIADQERDISSARPRFRTLCFWLYSELSALEPRLDARVDQMIERGLLTEINELRAISDSGASTFSNHHDYTLGIYQCIGYKEFHEYLNDPSNETAFDTAVERMKLSTRQYAKKQISWIRNKLLPAIRNANDDDELVSFYALDATEVEDRWLDVALHPALDITKKMLKGEPLPDPKSLSPLAARILDIPIKTANPVEILQARKKDVCLVCTQQKDRPVMIEEGTEWQQHLQTRVHKRLAERRKRIEQGIHGGSKQPESKPSDSTMTNPNGIQEKYDTNIRSTQS